VDPIAIEIIRNPESVIFKQIIMQNSPPSSSSSAEASSVPFNGVFNKFSDIAQRGKSIALKGKTIAQKGLSLSLNTFHSTAQSVGLKDKVMDHLQ
jgi:hypothetical protein